MWRNMTIRKSGIIALLVLASTTLNAQTFNEWFRQKKTQIKYLLEQIGQLQAQLELVKKGYKIVGEGLDMVHQIKEGEFNLHYAFITSLKKINPAIAQYADVADIAATQAALFSSCAHIVNNAVASKQFTVEEINLFIESFESFKEEVAATLSELVKVTTAGKLEMTDEERIIRIQKLRQESEKQRVSLQKMGNQIDASIKGRLIEAGDIELIRKLYGGQN